MSRIVIVILICCHDLVSSGVIYKDGVFGLDIVFLEHAAYNS
jgi:hypothetical protein